LTLAFLPALYAIWFRVGHGERPVESGEMPVSL
jgi:hypothetical protein